jgi:radical SAM family uncharacterized protein/radical SAM-linked protein
MNIKEILINEILPCVEKPSRYLGSELNSVHKQPTEVELRVCLLFPDIYELGLGNAGLHILYGILNALDWVWAERGYSPALDMEALLRERELPLFMYESKDPLSDADLIGITLQSELTYTNILNALDLGGVPLRTEDRGETDPLVCAGGPTSFNPEPLAPFIDFFVIGDGEEVIVEIAESLRASKGKTRREKLEILSHLKGIYVPELYPTTTGKAGEILPIQDGPKIERRVINSLNQSPFPVKYIVPFTQLIHDGIGLEVLRGCTQGCRFCQAGMVTRPVRERPMRTVEKLIDESLSNTGMDAVSLMSLSTCDYSRPKELLQRAAVLGRKHQASMSLPSIRLDSFGVELADQITGVRRSGLTFAPEAATPRLRSVINKFIPDEELLTMASEAWQRGWSHIKTYFMIGLPTERDEDVDAIADLCIRTLEVGKAITPRAMVRTGVSTFVPKPFTPFQWAEQIGMAEIIHKHRILSEKFRAHSGIKFGRHEAETSFIEGLLSRADRRAADLIEAAWRNGARLETFSEHVHIEHWMKAIEEVGYDVEAQFRERDLDEHLPWDHIDVHVSAKWLREDWERAKRLEYAPDCRDGDCWDCGVKDTFEGLCKAMQRKQERGRVVDSDVQTSTEPLPEQPHAVQRIRFRIGRSGEACLLGHLEWKDAWVRAFRRLKTPLAYSHGFHAQPKINFATATPLGEASEWDYMDVLLYENKDVDFLVTLLKVTLPMGFHVYEAFELPRKSPALMSIVAGFDYQLRTSCDTKILQQRIRDLMDQDEVLIERKTKATRKKNKRWGKGEQKRTTTVNVRPMIEELRVEALEGGKSRIDFSTRMVDKRLVKPREVIALLQLKSTQTQVLKRCTYLDETGVLATI